MSTTAVVFRNLIDLSGAVHKWLVKSIVGNSTDIKAKLRAKLLDYLLLIFSIYVLVSLTLHLNVDLTRSMILMLGMFFELRTINSPLSGIMIFSLILFFNRINLESREDTLAGSIWLALCPVLGCFFTTGKKLFIMALFWSLVLWKYYQPIPLTPEECLRSEEKSYLTLMAVSFVATVASELTLTDIEKDTKRLHQKHQELKRLNKELSEMKERAIDYSNQLKLTVQKLEESNLALEQALTAKRNFITKVSDELRNPLNSIMGNIELLEDQKIDHHISEKLISIKWSADLLLQMANNIIDASKLQLGTIEINKRRSSILGICERLWALNCQKMKQKNIRGLLYLSKNVPKYLVLDEEKLLVICHNMLTNSVKYTEKGNIRIFITWCPKTPTKAPNTNDGLYSLRPFCETARTTVKCTDTFAQLEISERAQYQQELAQEQVHLEPQSNPVLFSSVGSGNMVEEDHESNEKKVNLIPSANYGTKKEYLVLNTERSVFSKDCMELNDSPSNIEEKGTLKIEIIDSGCGMDSSIFPWLYKSIFHTDSKLTQQLGGKGLGLYVSSELTKLMGGEMRYFTKKNAGTSIIISIPTETPTHYQTSKAFLRYISAMNLDTKRIALVVDDEKINREILTSYLRKLNIYALHAENGAEAVRIFKEKPEGYFCFATMDLFMPVLNGIDACRQIRELETLQKRKTRLKIVVITANCTEQDKDDVMNPEKSCRADFFFRKPLTMNDCQCFVQEILNKKNLLLNELL